MFPAPHGNPSAIGEERGRVEIINYFAGGWGELTAPGAFFGLSSQRYCAISRRRGARG